MAGGAPEALAAARDAFDRADWAGAEELYDRALAGGEDAEALDGRGQARWWLARREEGIADRRRAYALYRRAGALERAAVLAVYLAGEARIDGNRAEAGGWLARGERLLADLPEGAAHGWHAIELAKRAPDPADRRAHAERAVDIGRRAGDPDVEVMGLSQLGLALVGEGRAEEGMRLLDEAMAAATGGEVEDPLAVGDTCCTTLVACARLDDLDRAAGWCRVVVDFTGRRRFTPLAGWCRAIYAGVLVTMGDWPRAEEHLHAALAAPDTSSKPGRDLALARLADLRLRQGRLEEAERLVAGREDRPAMLGPAVDVWLARGERDLAAAAVERRREAGDADEAPAIALAGLRVALAGGDPAAVRAAAARLRDLAAAGGREALVAAAGDADARAAAIAGDPGAPDLVRRGRRPLRRPRHAPRGGAGAAGAGRGGGGRGPRAGGPGGAGGARRAHPPGGGARRRPGGRPAAPPGGLGPRHRPRRGGPDPARGGGPRPARRGPVERRDRRPPGHQPQDRRAPRGAGPREAGPALPRGGRRPRRPGGHRGRVGARIGDPPDATGRAVRDAGPVHHTGGPR